MNSTQLLANFDRLAEAPNAVPRLRRFILDLAVRGKLVAQDAGDESATELLERIRAEKMKLVQDRLLRSDKELPAITDVEMRLTLPPGWAWVRLGSLSHMVTSGSRDWAKYYSEDGPIFVRMGNLSRDSYQLRMSNVQRVKPPSDGEGKRTSLQGGDILISITGEVGLLGLIPPDFGEAYINQHTCMVRPSRELSSRFLPELFRSSFAQDQFNAPQRGLKNSFRLTDVTEFVVPLPPLAEQHRIIAKVDELMALCDQLEAVQQERERRRERLAAASLLRLNQPATDISPEVQREHARVHLQSLPLLTTRPEHIKTLRKLILDLAVQGKLCPQDSNDEPANELVRRIHARKRTLMERKLLKLDKALSSIKAEEKQFSLPKGWAWSRLGNLAHLVTSGSRDWAKHYSETGPIFVRMGNLSRDSYQLRMAHVQRVTPPKDGEGKRTSLEAGDVLISITGEVGLLGLIPPNFGEAYINQHTCMVRPSPELSSRYLPELFRSTFAQAQFNAPQRGLKNSFRLTDVTEFLVPLPPLAEQHRIVAKVDELMALCDQLETQLTIAQTDSQQLLDAVLDGALGIVRVPLDLPADISLPSTLNADLQIGKVSRLMTTHPAMTVDQFMECIDDLGGSALPDRLLKQTGLGEDVEAFYDLLRAARDSGKVTAPLGSGEIARRHSNAD